MAVNQAMADDQRHGRIFGLLFIITFVTSIPAYLLFQDILDDPAAYIAEDGKDNVMYLAVLLEFFLILANVGTAVALYPIAKRQNQALAIGFVAARIIESVFIAGRDDLHSRSRQPAPGLSGRGRSRRLAGRLEGLDVPVRPRVHRSPRQRADPRLPHVSLRPRPPAHGLARDDRRATPLHLEHRRPLRVVGDRQHDPGPLAIPEFIWEPSLGITAPSGASEGLTDLRPTGAVMAASPVASPIYPSQRGLALSGVVFAILFLVGWFASGGDAPDYAASDQDWTDWADDNRWKSRIGAFAMLLAGFVFLHFVGTIRTVLGDAETTVRGSVQLARVAFAGALTGMAGMTTAIVIIAARDVRRCRREPVVSSAVTTASAGPFLLSAMGFAAFLGAVGLADTSIRRFRPLDGCRGADRRGLVSRSVRRAS